MSVYKDARSDNYTIEFQIGGERYKKTHEGLTNQRDAENLERGLKIAMKDRQRAQKDQRGRPITIIEAVERYVSELEGTSSYPMAGSYGKDAVAFFTDYTRLDGSALTLLSEIDDADIAAYVKWKSEQSRWGQDERGRVANSTVNQVCVCFMRRVCRNAVKVYRAILNKEPDWESLKLKESKKRTRRISDAEHKAILGAIDPDVAYLVQFALVSGIRKSGSLLEWKNVDFENKKYKYVNKGNDPLQGFELKEQTMTPAAEAILRSRVGHHSTYVFTRIGKRAPFRGDRIPIKTQALDECWRKIRTMVGANTLCWHDLRRSFASNLYKTTKDLALVQDALAHQNITTTRGYVVVDDDDLVSGKAMAEKRFMDAFTPALAITHAPRLIEDKRDAG